MGLWGPQGTSPNGSPSLKGFLQSRGCPGLVPDPGARPLQGPSAPYQILTRRSGYLPPRGIIKSSVSPLIFKRKSPRPERPALQGPRVSGCPPPGFQSSLGERRGEWGGRAGGLPLSQKPRVRNARTQGSRTPRRLPALGTRAQQPQHQPRIPTGRLCAHRHTQERHRPRAPPEAGERRGRGSARHPAPSPAHQRRTRVRALPAPARAAPVRTSPRTPRPLAPCALASPGTDAQPGTGLRARQRSLHPRYRGRGPPPRPQDRIPSFTCGAGPGPGGGESQER